MYFTASSWRTAPGVSCPTSRSTGNSAMVLWLEISNILHSGAFGKWLSNQQFTIRNVQITNAVSAIYQLWNWGFTWQNIQISCGTSSSICSLLINRTATAKLGSTSTRED
jgi:hypothetical protein